MTEDIKVTFIIPKHCRSENDCSEDMQLAFTACEQHSGGGLQAQWEHETKYNQFQGLTKRDVFVLSDFEGDLYQKLKATKCLLVGPRCLSCCLTEGSPIPSGPEPVFTVAMRGLVVTASGMSKLQKEKIKKKVFWMGGIYNSALTDDTTHLVSDTVLSDKYTKSIEKGIPVMCESWIDAVWDLSLRLNISGSSSEFDVHRLPPFANLQVTTTSISRKDKQMIMKLVNEHGGTYSGAFQSETTDVVVLNKDGVGSEKYKAAMEYGKACVLPTWVRDSAARGVALPFARYRVAGASTSSPLAEHRLPDMSLNFSRITNTRAPSNYVDETRSNDVSTFSGRMKLSQDIKKSCDTSVDKDVLMAFENLDMSSIKKAGPIFDGFCIWVTGLEGLCRERATACVSRAGGVRYDCPHERVTHIVAGSVTAANMAAQALPNVPVLSALWLAKSVEAGKALDEAEFLIDAKPQTPRKARKPDVEAASPMSKRNLQLLRPPPPPAPLPAPPEPEPVPDIVHHYLSQNVEPEVLREKTPEPAPPDVTTRNEQTDITEDEPTEEIEQIFRGMKIEVQGLDDQSICETGAELVAAGGLLVAAGAGGSHALVPLDFDPDDLVNKHAEPVTVFWVRDCLTQQELVPIEYFHRPVNMPPPPARPPLHGVVASLSTYSGVERAFLDELLQLLGATTQLRFCRRNTANALASTHLICPAPSGDKYLGALKWGLPAVSARWLLDCAGAGRKLSERGYLVGDTKAPPSPEAEKPVEAPEPEQECIQAAAAGSDKENAMLPPALPAAPRRGSLPTGEHTPKAAPKMPSDNENELSPASRYIAMARQGLLGGDTQETPTRVQLLKQQHKQDGECGMKTPPLEDALSTPNLRGLSPTTRRRVQAVRRGEMPSDPIKTPTDPFEKVETPDSAFGAALRPGATRMSPDARKRLWSVVQQLPGKTDEPHHKHTPLSEIRNRFLAQFNGDAPTPPSDHHAAPRKLCLQDQSETPPAKVPKLSTNQNASSATPKSDLISTSDAKNADDSSKSASSTLPLAVDAQLQRLSAALNGLSGQRQRRATRDSITVSRPIGPELEPAPESQPNTVGWDDTTPHQPPSAPPRSEHIKRFMLSSNVDNREEIIEMIMYLGGAVCDGTELDLEATHLLCAAPGRSEKMLGSIAAGLWVLHPAYVARSRANDRFLDEEDFEWGNPRATCLPPLGPAERTLARAAHRWRHARNSGLPGPFSGVVALLHVPPARRRLLARLVSAGDGLAPDHEPPYSNEDITVCFADLKRYPLSDRDAAWLLSRRVPVCAPVLLSSYLTDDERPDPLQHCLPDFKCT